MSMTSSNVFQRLSQAGNKVRMAKAAHWLLAGTAVSIFILLFFCLLDYLVRLGAPGRWIGFISFLAPLLTGFVLAIRHFQSKPNFESMARRIETCTPEGGGNNPLISFVQFSQALPDESPLKSAVLGEIHDPFPQVQWGRVFDTKALLRFGGGLGATLFLCALWGFLSPQYFGNAVTRMLLPASPIAALTKTKLVAMQPGDTTVAHGMPLRLEATFAGDVPKVAWVRFREEGGDWQKILMTGTGQPGVFTFEWPEVYAPFEYLLLAGDLQTSTHQVAVRARTTIDNIRLEVAPPAYTGRPPFSIEAGGILPELIAGSEIKATFTFNNPVRSMNITSRSGTSAQAAAVKPGQWLVTATPTQPDSLSIEFTDEGNVTETSKVECPILADNAPAIELRSPAEHETLVVSPGDRVVLDFTATDNVGLKELALVQIEEKGKEPAVVHAFADAAGQASYQASHTLTVPGSIATRQRLVYQVRAADGNDVSGPGITLSAPITLAVTAKETAIEKAGQTEQAVTDGLTRVIEMQEANIGATQSVITRKATGETAGLLSTQLEISEKTLNLTIEAAAVSPKVKQTLVGILRGEMPTTIAALRDADGVPAQVSLMVLPKARRWQELILAKLKGAALVAQSEAERSPITEVTSGLEELLVRQRDVYMKTKGAPPEQGPKLSGDQDALASRAEQVAVVLKRQSANTTAGDEEFRKRLLTIAGMFKEKQIHDNMFRAAEMLDAQNIPKATDVELTVIKDLSEMVKLLNEWQVAKANETKEELKEELQGFRDQLAALRDIQAAIVEKSREFSRKNEINPEDVATLNEIQDLKELMKEVMEQMVTDLHIFPEMAAGNELMQQLSQIFEDLEQKDLEAVKNDENVAKEYDFVKDEKTLEKIEEAAKAEELTPQTEAWLATKQDKAQNDTEAFDTQEFPEIPMVPLPETYSDMVGDLLKEQESMQNDDSSTNSFDPTYTGGWGAQEGPLSSMGGMGVSGNEKPSHSEQGGRSSGGRTGMSTGEMAGSVADHLQGDTPDARRTNENMQAGYVEDPAGMQLTPATGGGKGSGFSDRQGMEGDAPLRKSNAPEIAAASARAAAQAQLAEKASQKVAEAEMLYMNPEGLREVARLMDANAQALRQGQFDESATIHEKVVSRLRQLQGGMGSARTAMTDRPADAKTEERVVFGGTEGRAPETYRAAVADYFRALSE